MRVEMAFDREFVKELEQLLNKHGIDSRLNMPDFILAELTARHLLALQYANSATATWRKSSGPPSVNQVD